MINICVTSHYRRFSSRHVSSDLSILNSPKPVKMNPYHYFGDFHTSFHDEISFLPRMCVCGGEKTGCQESLFTFQESCVLLSDGKTCFSALLLNVPRSGRMSIFFDISREETIIHPYNDLNKCFLKTKCSCRRSLSPDYFTGDRLWMMVRSRQASVC